MIVKVYSNKVDSEDNFKSVYLLRYLKMMY